MTDLHGITFPLMRGVVGRVPFWFLSEDSAALNPHSLFLERGKDITRENLSLSRSDGRHNFTQCSLQLCPIPWRLPFILKPFFKFPHRFGFCTTRWHLTDTTWAVLKMHFKCWGFQQIWNLAKYFLPFLLFIPSNFWETFLLADFSDSDKLNPH